MPTIFGTAHIFFLIVYFLVFAIAIFVANKIKDERNIELFIKTTALLLLLFVVLTRVGDVIILFDDLKEIWISTFCSFSSFTLSLAVLFLKKDNLYFHFICPMALLGGLIPLFYPEFIGSGDSIFFLSTFASLMHHGILFFLVVVMLLKRYYVPTMKKWYALPIGLIIELLYGCFLVFVIHLNDAFLIKEPIIKGTPFYWFLIVPGYLAFSYLFILTYEYFINKKKSK